MNKPGLPRNWQNVIWREWRNCEDEEYASYLFDLVADEPAGWVAVVILALLGALYGAIIGLLVGLIATNWETPSQPELWRLLWLTLLDYAWRGGCLGAAGLVIRMLGRQRLSWRKWLGMFTAIYDELFGVLTVLLVPVVGLVVMLVVGLGVMLVVGLLTWLVILLVVWLVVWLVLWRVEEAAKHNVLYAYHFWWFWWRTRPYVAETDGALRQITDQQFNAKHIWGELLYRIEIQRQSRLSPDKLIATLQDGDWTERFVARHILVAQGDNVELLIRALGDKNKDVRWVVAQSLAQLGNPCAVEPLIRIRGDKDRDVRRASTQAIRTICQDNQRLLGSGWPGCVCTEHLNRFTHWRVSLSFFEKTGYYACRICQADQPRYEAVSDVVLVLDDRNTDPSPVQQEHILYAPWSLTRGIFDFDAVEIRAADSSNIERFLVQFEEDADPVRPWKQKSAGKPSCRVSPGCALSPADRARLQRHFEIIDGNNS